MHAPPDILLKIAIIAGSGILAQWLAWRLRWPSIVLMMGAGLILGPLWGLATGEPFLDPQALFGEYLRPMVALAVAVILFEGGLTLNFRDLRESGGPVWRMIALGFPLTWAAITVAAHYILGLDWDLSALTGAILTVTGPTVVLPLLRQAKLPSSVSSVLKWEGIVVDPMGALAAVFVYEALRRADMGASWLDAGLAIVMGAAIGAVIGLVAGYGLSLAFKRGLVPENMKAPLTLAAVVGCYAASDMVLPESGLVAVTVFGVVFANARLASIEEMRRFKEGFAALLVASVFVALAASLTPESLLLLDWRAALFILVLMLVVRPLIVPATLAGSTLKWPGIAFVSAVAPRGVVAAATAGHLAGLLVESGREDAAVVTPLIFATVFATVFGYGFLLGPLAKFLGLIKHTRDRLLIVGANPWTLGLADALKAMEVPFTIADTNWRRLRKARLAGHDTYHGEVLSETAEYRLEPGQFATLLAATANEAYNALVCVDHAPELGRSHVYQLSAQDPAAEGQGEDDPKAIAFTARGRTLLARGRNYEAVSADWWRGWRFRATKITEEYTVTDALASLSEGAEPVLELRSDGRIALLGPARKPQGGPGSVLLSFGPPAKDADAPS
ncbi:cation:proton antiporter [Hyphobacterium marinum]|uniref:Sodium:proton antiporter n=1 Tax=Hyphobacterium marinum TaxID=3116574 RepID=A0ABU7LVJ7_9PROT|nr:sodium:proton antiporter [Hyphobacterium sp. Y6023]MEE2565588.1 sodium:proton antiporter [Hyphobacterium sp. Y6023]